MPQGILYTPNEIVFNLKLVSEVKKYLNFEIIFQKATAHNVAYNKEVFCIHILILHLHVPSFGM